MTDRPVTLTPASQASCDRKVAPCDGEVRELLYYFEGIASEAARRQIIAKAAQASSSDRLSTDHFEK